MYHFFLPRCGVFAASGEPGGSAAAIRGALPAMAVMCLWPAGDTAKELAHGWTVRIYIYIDR